MARPDAAPTPETMLTPTQVAQRLAVDRETIYRLIGSGDLAAIDVATRPGRKVWRIPADDLEAFLTIRRAGQPRRRRSPSFARRLAAAERDESPPPTT